MADHVIPPHGGYKRLLTFQKAEIVYDATVAFCAELVRSRYRTRDLPAGVLVKRLTRMLHQDSRGLT